MFKIRDPESTIRIVAESAMREVIGRTDIQPALTDARGTIQSDTRRVMQRMLDDYEAGVEINGVQLQKVDPPQPVVDAFNEVQRARDLIALFEWPFVVDESLGPAAALRTSDSTACLPRRARHAPRTTAGRAARGRRRTSR